MAPPKKGDKKGGKGGKAKKGNKPAWMSDGLWELSQNLPKLSEFYCGEIKDSKLKEGQAPPPTITRTQAGLFIWQLLFPNNKQGKEKREEAVKLGVVETSVKVLAGGKSSDVTPALGILVAMTSGNAVMRQVMLDAKPSPLPNLLGALADESASLRASACGLVRVLAREDDSRTRLWRAMRVDWDWGLLINCLDLTDMSQLGGRSACYDAAASLEALCGASEQDIANGASAACMAAGAPAHIVRVLRTKNAHPMAKAACVAVLNQLLRRASPEVCEEVALGLGALEPIVGVFGHPVVPLPYKAHAAACLLRFIMPDSLWRQQQGAAKAAAGAAGEAAPAGGDEPGGGSGTVPGTPAGALQAALARGLGLDGLAGGRDGAGGGIEVPDVDLLDDATREQVVRRARQVAQLEGAIPWLVKLCVGPDGPLPDLEAVVEAKPAGEEAEGDDGKKKKKGKKGKGKKGKKGKLDPGMAEAQAYCTAVLRLISLAEEQRGALVAAGLVRYLLPLLEAKTSPARWNTRQTLINLSMTPELLPKLQLYKVPDYIHQANVPASHYDRPAGSGQGTGPTKIAHQDSLGRKGEAKASGAAKPAPLKVPSKN